MFKLYYFNPETLYSEGYTYVDSFEWAVVCTNRVSLDGALHYRIEEVTATGTCVVFESESQLQS